MRILRMVFFACCPFQWFAVYYNESSELFEFDPISGEDVPAKLAQLETDFPAPGYGPQYGYEFANSMAGYMFDRAAIPS